MTLKLTLR